MTEGIAHAGGIGTIEQVCRWLNFFGAGFDCAPQQGLVVIGKNMETRRAAAKRPWLRVELVIRVANHHQRAAYQDLGVQYLAVGTVDP